jgi:chromosome segregation ATPase
MAGCTKPAGNMSAATHGEPQSVLVQRINTLTIELAQERREKAILQGRLFRFNGQDKSLTDQLAQLRSINSRLDQQAKAFEAVKAERDNYKAEVERLNKEIADLRAAKAR